jgi:DNA repair photolyase
MAHPHISNPANPFQSLHHEFLEEPPPADLHVFEERARTLLSRNDSPDVGFTWSANPYRGCLHGCAYCYARPSHQYLDFGAGTDFEKKIVVKVNAPELLERELSAKRWSGDTVAFSGNTDCYQALEARYELTKRCLEVCERHRNPVMLITKASLVARDAALLGRLARGAGASVHVSIPFADPRMARALEPWAPAPAARFRAMRALADAGVPVGVAVAPIIPGLSECQVPEVLERAAAAGARSAFRIMLRLPAEVKPVFLERLQAEYPGRFAKVVRAIAEARGGRMNDPRFGNRMRGSGPRWESAARLFDVMCARLGLNKPAPEARPRSAGQLNLFA